MWTRGKLLGCGSFGEVYLAKTCKDRKHLLPPIMAVKTSPISESDILREEQKLLNLFEDCPQIVNCFGSDVTTMNGEKVYNLHLEYASGGSLGNVLRMEKAKGRKGLEEGDVRDYTKSILMGLHYIHRLGYVHCDIKPDNLLVFGNTEAKKVKISDFGLTKRSEEKIEQATIRGTAMYVAPESITDNKYETKVDIWALGCTVLQLLTGKEPWPDSDEWSVIREFLYLNGTPDIPIWMSNEAQDFLRKCFVKDPRLRWTANMLLKHPFVSTILEEDQHRQQNQEFLVHHHQCCEIGLLYRDVLIGF